MDLSKIQLVSLDVENLNDTEILIAAEYDNGEIISEEFGNAAHRGHLMFSLPYDIFVKTNENVKILKEQSSEKESFVDWAIRKGLVDKNDKSVTKHSALDSYVSRLFSSAEIVTVGAKFAGLIFFLDDIFDSAAHLEESIEAIEVKKVLENLETTILNIFAGVYSANHKLESPDYPQFTVLYNCVLEIYSETITIVKDYEQKCHYFLQAWKNMMRQYQKFPNWRSETTHMRLKRESGFLPLFEMILLLHGVWIPEDIRSSLLFELFYESVCSAIVLTNDVFSLKKELTNGEAGANLIFFKVTRNNMTLQDALDCVTNLSNATIMDFMDLCKLLKEKWPQNEDLDKCIFLFKRFLDASLKYGIECPRYGDMSYTIKRVEHLQ